METPRLDPGRGSTDRVGSSEGAAGPRTPAVNQMELLPVELLSLIWQQLVASGNRRGAQSLMASSRAMRTAWSSFVHKLKVELPRAQGSSTQALARFPRHAVLRVLAITEHDDDDSGTDHARALEDSIAAGISARGPELFSQVHTVHLTCLVLRQAGGLSPLLNLIPSLRTLTVKYTQLHADSIVGVAGLQQLESFKLSNCEVIHCRNGADVLQPLSRLAGSLRSLRLTNNDFFEGGTDSDRVLESFSVLQQLTNLQHLRADIYTSVPAEACLPDATAQALGPNLQSLRLVCTPSRWRISTRVAQPLCHLTSLTSLELECHGGDELDEGAFEVLLGLPSLRDVNLGSVGSISVRPGTAAAHCSWTRLVFSERIASCTLAQLPLAGIQDIANSGEGQLSLDLRLGDDAAAYRPAMRAAVANLVRCPGVSKLKTVSLHPGSEVLDKMSALAALEPFLQLASAAPAVAFKLDLTELKLSRAQCKDLALALPRVVCMDFSCCELPEPGTLHQLPHLLPQLRELELGGTYGPDMDSAELAQLCVAARHAFDVTVDLGCGGAETESEVGRLLALHPPGVVLANMHFKGEVGSYDF